jgi:hypothetical protein
MHHIPDHRSECSERRHARDRQYAIRLQELAREFLGSDGVSFDNRSIRWLLNPAFARAGTHRELRAVTNANLNTSVTLPIPDGPKRPISEQNTTPANL